MASVKLRKYLQSYVLLLMILPVFAFTQTPEGYYRIKKADSLFAISNYDKAAYLFADVFSNKLWVKQDAWLCRYARTLVILGDVKKSKIVLDTILNSNPSNELLQALLDTVFRPEKKLPENNLLIQKIKQKRRELEKKFNHELNRELVNVFDNDQRYRVMIGDYVTRYGLDARETDSIINLQNKLDSSNLNIVLNTLKLYGWLKPGVVSEKARTAIWAILCHADTSVQKRVLPQMEQAVRNGFLDGGSLAYIRDKLTIEQRGLQLYGTQFQWNETENAYELMPLLDISAIDQQRAKLGLEPLREYLKENNITIFPNQYK